MNKWRKVFWNKTVNSGISTYINRGFKMQMLNENFKEMHWGKWDGIQSCCTIPISTLCFYIYGKGMRKSMRLECTKPPNHPSMLHFKKETFLCHLHWKKSAWEYLTMVTGSWMKKNLHVYSVTHMLQGYHINLLDFYRRQIGMSWFCTVPKLHSG